MKTERIVLAIAIGIAFGITLAPAPGSAQVTTSDGTKPPKPSKSDDKGPKPTKIEFVSGADSWIAKVPATRTAFASGILTGGTGQAPCRETQAAAPVTGAVSAVAGLVLGSRSVGRADCAGPSAATAGDATAFRSQVVLSLTEAGAPLTEASALTDAMTGILAQPKSGQLAESVDRFNRLVMATPDNFLANPPPSFLAIHAVLARLLGVANTR